MKLFVGKRLPFKVLKSQCEFSGIAGRAINELPSSKPPFYADPRSKVLGIGVHEEEKEKGIRKEKVGLNLD
uniref:Uncharacterized protein n=1 Tax=Vespula pensylvanica TaxID=30213 RepID=A0A834PF34_VESPE|nr:hypothetical protein H0235_000881 [Vespula pensylvanica]